MNWFRKMAGYLVRPVSIKDPATWPTTSGEIVSGERSALALSSVYACVRLLSDTQAGLPCQVFKDGPDGGRDIVRDHPLYRILHDSPNADQTAFEFWAQIALSLELRGNAYAIKGRLSGRIVSLVPLHPDCVSAQRLSDGRIWYTWTDGGRSFKGTDYDILHFRGFGGDALGGLSTLEIASNTFSLAKAINTAAQKSFNNSMNPSGVLSFKDYMPQDKRAQIDEALQNKYIGAVNSGRPLVLEGGASWQQLSIKPEEAQMLESRGFSVEEICRFFGTPPFMIGHTEKTTSWGTGLTEQVQGFQKFALSPRIERLEQRLMKELLTPEEKASGHIIEFNFDGLLRSDTFKRFQAYEIALRNGWETINSVRRTENKPPIAGGDVPRMQSQNVPITYVDRQYIGNEPGKTGE
jgi:HK97 family phage portal protein